MRTWGRVTDEWGTKTWVEVSTDASGFNDMVYITTLVQVLRLNLNESPFNANYGIPAHQSVIQQIHPDYYITYTQQKFAPYFASLIVSKLPTPPNGDPVYRINATTRQGFRIEATAVPSRVLDGFGNPVFDGFGNPVGGPSVFINAIPT